MSPWYQKYFSQLFLLKVFFVEKKVLHQLIIIVEEKGVVLYKHNPNLVLKVL